MGIRQARREDLAALRDIERSAAEAFRDIGMPEIADDEPPTLAELEGPLEDGTAWVMDEADRIVAYLIAERIDGNLHIEQVSVHRDHAGKRFGRRLIDYAATQATAHGMPALTLTTFRDVPWNAPYYERCGFRVIPDDELTPGLEARRQKEADHGLDRWPRVCMRRPTLS
jgi:GNAT superfamily N-acetyltransferase